jgi:hypothetical protein
MNEVFCRMNELVSDAVLAAHRVVSGQQRGKMWIRTVQDVSTSLKEKVSDGRGQYSSQELARRGNIAQ